MTDRPAPAEDHAPLSDAELDRIESHAETWREMHDVAPEELMDIDVLLTEARRARAEASRLRAELADARTDYQNAIDAGAEVVLERATERARLRAENTALAEDLEFVQSYLLPVSREHVAQKLAQRRRDREYVRALGGDQDGGEGRG